MISGKIILVFGFMFGLALALALVFEFATPKQLQKKTITILRGENALQIANDLKAEGYIANKVFFLFQVIKDGDLKRLKAGEYNLKGLDYAAIIDKLVKAQTIARTITVVPGWTVPDIALGLRRMGISAGKEFWATSSPELLAKFDFLSDPAVGRELEGYLYPDTYQLPDNPSADDIKLLMLENFNDKLTSVLRGEVKKQDKSIFEIMTMASILEKEVKTLEDKKTVSGILWKRLESGMPLQVDSTLLYYKVAGTSGQINKDADSLYNTYKFSGLPAGPICNPGLESINAAIEPTDSPYWYYLSAPDGKTVFSKNYDDHLINIAKYLN